MIIYRATSPSGKSYIGQTTRSLNQRKQSHIADMKRKGKCEAFHSALRRYGVEEFQWEVLACACCQSVLNVLEEAYVALYETVSPRGYNLHEGGTGGGKRSVLTRQRHSIAALRRTQTEEGRENLRLMTERATNYWRGRKQSPEQIAKRAQKNSIRFRGEGNPMFGRKKSAASIAKFSAKMKGRKQSLEHVAKRAASNKRRAAAKKGLLFL